MNRRMTSMKNNLVVKSIDNPVYQHIINKKSGFTYLNFQARSLKSGETICGDTDSNEYLFVLLGGNFSAYTSKGKWKTINGRKDVFSGLPHALYLPPKTSFTIKAEGDQLDIAMAWTPAEKTYEAQFITPEDVHNMGIELLNCLCFVTKVKLWF